MTRIQGCFDGDAYNRAVADISRTGNTLKDSERLDLIGKFDCVSENDDHFLIYPTPIRGSRIPSSAWMDSDRMAYRLVEPPRAVRILMGWETGPSGDLAYEGLKKLYSCEKDNDKKCVRTVSDTIRRTMEIAESDKNNKFVRDAVDFVSSVRQAADENDHWWNHISVKEVDAAIGPYRAQLLSMPERHDNAKERRMVAEEMLKILMQTHSAREVFEDEDDVRQNPLVESSIRHESVRCWDGSSIQFGRIHYSIGHYSFLRGLKDNKRCPDPPHRPMVESGKNAR